MKVKFFIFLCLVLSFFSVSKTYAYSATDVHFPKGKTGTTVTGEVSKTNPQSYKVNVKAGQWCEVDLRGSSCKSCYLYILTPSGTEVLPVYADEAGRSNEYDYWSDQLQESGNYVFTVESKSRKVEKFNLKLKVTNHY